MTLYEGVKRVIGKNPAPLPAKKSGENLSTTIPYFLAAAKKPRSVTDNWRQVLPAG